MLTLEFCVACVMLISLIIYMLTGGADFGGGIWDLFATGPRAKVTTRHLSRKRSHRSGKQITSG